jgi:hypothetical protein
MKRRELALPYEEQADWEKLIEPMSPDSPLIRLQQSKEPACYKAVFGVEFRGVSHTGREHKNTVIMRCEQEHFTSCYRNLLFRGISADQELHFIYNGGTDLNGHEYFDWKIMGCSTGETADDVLKSINKLWQELNVNLGVKSKDYFFSPITSSKRLQESKIVGPWISDIRPAGIVITDTRQKNIGFNAENIFLQNTGENMVILPHIADKAAKDFDSFVTGVQGCPGNVTLVSSISPVTLSHEEVLKIAAARELICSGNSKNIRYQHDVGIGSKEDDLLKRLSQDLNLWVRNPKGYSINCSAISDQPIPASFLTMIGREVFKGADVIIDEKDNGVRKTFEGFSSTATSNVIDLSNCINICSDLPPLFPGVSTLKDSGANRFYSYSSRVGLSKTGILLGHVGGGKSRKDVRLSRSDRSRHTYIIGATGTGKSTLLYNMIIQDVENGEGVALIDPHGDLYQQVLMSIPRQRINDIVVIDPCDFDNAVGINFLECDGPYKQVQMNFITNELIKIFDRLYNLRETGGPVFESYMRNALMLVMDNEFSGSTLMDIPMIFEDKSYREFLKARCKNPIVVNFWNKQAEEVTGENSLRNMGPYITSKLNQFTSNALLRPIVGQSKSTINFRRMIDSGKIILVNLSKGLLGEMDTSLLGMLIIGKIFSSSMGRVTINPKHRRPLFLYVDEFQNFTTDSVAHLVSEARKFGLYLTLANQNLSQLSERYGRQNIADAVLGNVGNMLIFRLGVVDAEKMQTYTKPELYAQHLQELPDFHVVGRILNDNTPSRPFVFQTLPMQQNENRVDVSEAITLSRKQYTRPTKEVENEIIKRRTSYKVLQDVADKIINKITAHLP